MPYDNLLCSAEDQVFCVRRISRHAPNAMLPMQNAHLTLAVHESSRTKAYATITVEKPVWCLTTRRRKTKELNPSNSILNTASRGPSSPFHPPPAR